MTDRKRHGERGDESWEIDGVSEAARQAAERAAADGKVALGIWMAETVLRATQEGDIGGDRAPEASEAAKPAPKTP